MIKRIFTCLITVLLFTIITTGCAKKEDKEAKDQLSTIKARGELIVGVKFDTKPFGFVENGKIQGYDIDVAHLIAKRLLGNEKLVRFVEVNTSNRISKLNSGEVDMVVATMTITPQRQEIVDFSLPYYYTGQAIMVRKGAGIKKVSDLNGRRVIVVLSTTGEKNLRYFAPEARVIGFKSYKDAFNGFLDRKAEAMISDDSILAGFVLDHPEFTMLPQRYSQEGYGIALRKGSDNEALMHEINAAIGELRSRGHLNYLKTRWLPQASTGFKESKKEN